MNPVDIVILLIIGISCIYGFYHGFLQTVLSLIGTGVSLLAGLMFGPRLTQLINANTGIQSALATYTDAIARVGDYDLANTRVLGLSQNVIETIMKSVNLPEPIAGILRGNLKTEAFSASGLKTVNDYVSTTIVTAAIDILSFLAVFALCYLVCSLLISLIQHVFRLSILRHMDWLAGGAVGLIRGGIIVYLLLLAVPFIETVVPKEMVGNLLGQSTLAPIFQNPALFMKVVGK